MIWPFKRKSPEIEMRAFGPVTADFINTRRKGLISDQGVPLSATIGTALHFWTSGLSMVETAPEPIDPNVLSAIARDLLFRGESCWHIRLTRGQLDLQSVPYWDQVSEGQYHLHIPRINKTETIKRMCQKYCPFWCMATLLLQGKVWFMKRYRWPAWMGIKREGPSIL